MLKANILSLLLLGCGFSLMGSESKPKIFECAKKEQQRIQLEADKKGNNRNMAIVATSVPVGILGFGLLVYNGCIKGETGLWTTLMSVPLLIGYLACVLSVNMQREKTNEEYNKLMQQTS